MNGRNGTTTMAVRKPFQRNASLKYYSNFTVHF